MENFAYSDLIQKLLNCSLACENCAVSCLNEPDVINMKRCISLDRDCADVCLLGVSLLKRNSEISKQFLLLCEHICRLCSEECGKHEHDHCQECAAACRICADACRKVLGNHYS